MWVKMIAKDTIGDMEFWAIILSIIFAPLIWVLVRKENSTDIEGREPPIFNKLH